MVTQPVQEPLKRPPIRQMTRLPSTPPKLRLAQVTIPNPPRKGTKT